MHFILWRGTPSLPLPLKEEEGTQGTLSRHIWIRRFGWVGRSLRREYLGKEQMGFVRQAFQRVKPKPM